MARKIGKKKIMQGLINSVYDTAIAQQQAQAQAQMQTPALNSGMTIDQINQIYDSAIAANNQTTPQTSAQEIPKLEDTSLQANQPTSNPTIASELERMQKMKAENKPRSESEQRAIDTYLADLQRASAPDFKPDYQAEIERMNALNNDTETNWSEGEINARNDYLAKLQDALAEEQRKNAIVTNPTVKKTSSRKKFTSEVVKDEPKKEQTNFTRTMSANEQRDLERAMSAASKAYTKEASKKIDPVATAEFLAKGNTDAVLQKKAEQRANYANLSEEGKHKVDEINYKKAVLQETEKKPANYTSRMRKFDSDIEKVYENDPGVSNGTIEQALNPNKKLTKEEKKQFKQQIKDYEQSDVNENAYTLVFDDAHPDGMMVPVYTVDENGNYDPSKELTPEQRQEQQDIYALKGKMSAGDTALHGMGSMIPGVSALQSVLYETDPSFRRMIDNAKTQNPVAYRGGQAAGFTMGAVESALTGGALEGTKYVSALDKLAQGGGVGKRILAESLKDLPFDVVTDIIPQLAGDINAGKSGSEIASDALLNFAINQGMNTAIPFLQNFGDVRSAVRGIGKNSANVADDVVDNALNPLEMAAKNADIENAIANQEQAVEEIQNLKQQIPIEEMELSDEVKRLLRERDNTIAEINDMGVDYPQGRHPWRIEEDIQKIAPQLFDEKGNLREIPKELYLLKKNNNSSPLPFTSETPIEQTVKSIPETPVKPIEYDRTKIANKELNDTLDSLHRMYEREGDAPLMEDLRAAINEAQLTGNEEALQRAKDIAAQLDEINAGRNYYTKKDREIRFGEGRQGTFSERVNHFEDSIRGSAKVRNTVIQGSPEINEMIDATFDRFEYTPERAEAIANFKKAVDNVLENPTDANNVALVDSAGKVLNQYQNAEEFVSSYRGKTKTKPFDSDDIHKIMQSVYDRSQEMYVPKNASQIPDEIPNVRAEEPNRVMAMRAEEPETASIEVDLKGRKSNNIPEGEDLPGGKRYTNQPVREFNTPDSGELNERGLANHIRSQVDVRVATPMKMEGVSDEVANDFVDNPDLYKVLKNKDTKALADNIYNSGDATIRVNGKEYTGNVETKFRTLLSEKNPSALPLGHQLAKDYSAAGNHEMAAQIYRDMGQALTESGQFSQAAIINMIRNDPLTALQYAEKQLDAINAQGASKFGKKWQDFSLTEDEIKAFNSITPGDEKAIKALYDKIGARLGKEYPTTFMEKLLEGRKVAMLFNIRTNVRNIGANVPTLGMRWISDRVDAVGQNIAHLINPNFKVTNSLLGSGANGRKLANEVFNSDKVQALTKGQSGKYEIPELKNSLMKDRQMFKGTAVSKWINKVTNGGIEKMNKALFNKEGVESGLETIRNATYKMLDLGDSPFVKENFVERLGSYINAQNIKSIDDIPDEAIQTAWEEAMKATYKDDSWAVEMLRGLKQGMEKIPGVGKPLSQAVIPFLQAPGNIAARMIDYSPIKATKGVVDIISGATKGSEVAVRKGIEEAAKGLTGTGLIILGMRLHESGILTGNYSEDKDQKNFEKQNGFKPWALHIGDKYFTYDWAQPFGEPLIIGSLLNEAIQNSDKYDSDILNHFGIEGSTAGSIIGATKEGAKASLNSWFNASPLQGLAELMQGDYSGNADIAQNLFDVGVSDFAGALVPAQVNAIAKSIDPTQRNTYDPSNKFGTFLNQQQAKIPGLSDNLPAKYNTWGEEMKYADSVTESALRRNLVPGDYGKDTDDPINMEINRLFESPEGTTYDERGLQLNNSIASDAGVFPLVAPNSVGGRKLNNEEVSAYQQDMGQRSRQMVEAFMDSELYQNMDDAQRIDALKNIYGISKAITERDLFGKPVSDTYKKKVEAFDNGNVEGVVKSFEANKLMDEAGVKSNSKIGQAITEAVESGNAEQAQKIVEDKKTLADYGLDKTNPNTAYEKAQTKFPNMSVEEFADMYKKIDGADGSKPNQGISQKELIPYFNMYHIPEDKALKIWYTFQKDDVAHIPVLEDGTWKLKKK